jgi:hypothetical protein
VLNIVPFNPARVEKNKNARMKIDIVFLPVRGGLDLIPNVSHIYAFGKPFLLIHIEQYPTESAPRPQVSTGKRPQMP